MEQVRLPTIIHSEPLLEIRRRPALTNAEMKAFQRAKIGDIRLALIAAGFVTLDEQAAALGLRRGTAWTVLKASHKASGLSAKIIKRMMTSSELPAMVRDVIQEYVEHKCAGVYGHSRSSLRLFRAHVGLRIVTPIGSDLATMTATASAAQSPVRL